MSPNPRWNRRKQSLQTLNGIISSAYAASKQLLYSKIRGMGLPRVSQPSPFITYLVLCVLGVLVWGKFSDSGRGPLQNGEVLVLPGNWTPAEAGAFIKLRDSSTRTENWEEAARRQGWQAPGDNGAGTQGWGFTCATNSSGNSVAGKMSEISNAYVLSKYYSQLFSVIDGEVQGLYHLGSALFQLLLQQAMRAPVPPSPAVQVPGSTLRRAPSPRRCPQLPPREGSP